MSVGVEITVENLDEFKLAMSWLDAKMQEHIHRRLGAWARDIKRMAQDFVPVDTGYLRSTIFAEVRDLVGEVGASAAYAAFVEFGTRHMRSKPYLYPAIQNYLPRLESIICEAIDAAALEVSR